MSSSLYLGVYTHCFIWKNNNVDNTRQRKPKGQSRMDNSEKTEGAIKNGQFREIGNVVYSRHWTRRKQ